MESTDRMSGRRPALEIRGLSKAFGHTRVLNGVSLDVRAGEIHALVGENGSGKSTLIKILAGFHSPDGGHVVVGEDELSFDGARAADRLGIRFVHQDLGLVGDLDVVDNLALGVGYRQGLAGRIRWGAERRAATEVLRSLGYDLAVRTPVASLTISERTAVAVARAFSERRELLRVLVLDEPTANLPEPEVERLFDLLRRVRDGGVAIVFVSHHFNEVFGLADRVSVLRDGSLVATRDVADVTEDGLIEMMIGRRLEVVKATHHSAAGEFRQPVLTVSGLRGAVVTDVELDVAAGEIVGVAGITGSGREELARLVAGDAPRQGVVAVSGRALAAERPDLALRSGMAYVPAERAANGLLHEHSVRENLTISRLGDFVRAGRVSRRREAAETERLLEEYDVRPRRSSVEITTLSGGNQQKVVMARAIRTQPDVLVLDEPTQGVDVGAQAQLHAIIRDQAARGAAVLVCSSVSEELAEIADRVVVLTGGRVTRELDAPLDPDEITAACLVDPDAAADGAAARAAVHPQGAPA